MKRHLSTLALMLVLVAMVFTLASCDTVNGLFGKEEHQHTYSADWSSDETNHWHAATCTDTEDCASAKNDVAAHEFGADGTCVCGYKKPAAEQPAAHEHTYADTLTAGETTHWYAATCTENAECATAKKDEAAHDFTNGDCVCGAKAPVAEEGTAENPIVVEVPGEIEIAYAGGDDLVWYVFTASATKNLKVTLSSANANMAYGLSPDDGLTYTKGETEVKLPVEEGVTYYVAFCTIDGAAETFTVTAEYVVSAYDAVIGLGSNNVYLSTEDIAANETTRKIVITEAGEYKIASGSIFMDKLFDADGNVIAKGTDNPTHPYWLEAGEYTAHFAMLSMFGATADVAYEVVVEKYVAPEGYILLGKVNGANAQFTYTADAEGIIYISVDNPVGGSVEIAKYSINGGAVINGGNGIYVKLNVGDTVTVEINSDEGATAKIAGEWTDTVLKPEGTIENLEGEGTSASPIVISDEDTYLITGVNAYPGKYFTYTATSNVTVTFTTDVPCLYSTGYGSNYGTTVTKSLIAGESVKLIACMDYGVCDVLLTVATEEYVPESDDELKVGETASVFVDAESQTPVTFTVTEAGTYIITVLTENGQLNNAMTGFPVESPVTAIFTDEELVEFGGSYTINYAVTTVDGAAGYVEIKVEKKTEGEDEDESAITGSGYNTDPYVVAGEGNVIISADKFQPIFVVVPAGFTATVDCAAQFYAEADPLTALGTSVTPAIDTLYLIYADSMAGCIGQLTSTIAQGGTDTPAPEVGTGSGTYEDPYIIAVPGDFVCEFPGGYNAIWYGFVATEDGKMVLSTTFGEGGWLIFGSDPMFADSNDGSGESVTIDVVAGRFYYVGVGDWNEVENTVPFSLAYSTGEDEGGEDEIVISGDIWDEIVNDIAVTNEMFTAGKAYYTFCPNYTGEYTFASDLYVANVIDAAGNVIERNDNWCYELIAWECYTLEISFAWIESEGTYEFEPVYKFPEGAKENPYWVEFEDGVANLVAEYKGDWKPVFYQFFAPADGVVTVTCTNAISEFFICGSFGYEIKNYDADENRLDSVSINVMGGRLYYIGITVGDSNYSDFAADLEFAVNFTEGEYEGNGTVNTPNILEIGGNTANIPAYNYVWYAFVAQANGTLTLTTESDNCKWYLTKDLEEYVDSTTDKTISIHLEWGDIVYLCMETANGEADEITFTASFKNDPANVYSENETLVDGTANEFVVEENTILNFNFWDAGNYIITWDNADAIVRFSDYGEMVELENGTVIESAMWGADLQVYFKDYAAGTVNITITPCEVSVEADGSFEAPYALEEENTCAFPGGYEYVFYKYTALVAGTLTVTLTGADFDWAYGTERYALNTVGTVASADIVLAEGEYVCIAISTYSADAADITFTATFTESTVEDEPTDGNQDKPYVITENADFVANVVVEDEIASYVYYVYTNNGENDVTVTVTFDGTNYFAYYGTYNFMLLDQQLNPNMGTAFEITIAAGASLYMTVSTNDGTAEAVSFSVAIQEVAEEPAVVIPALPMGSTQYNAVEQSYSYTASADGVLKLSAGAAIMGPVSFSYTVNGGDAVAVELSTTAEVAVSAGDVVILTITGSGYSSITASFAVPLTEVAGTLENLGENSFTLVENSYVLIPLQVMGLYQITWTDANIVVEYQESGRAPFVVIESGAVASLNPMAGANLKVYLTNYAAGTAKINVAEYVDAPVDAVVGDNTVSVVDTTNGKVVNLPVSDVDVTYVVTPGANAVVIYSNEVFFEAVEITVAAGATVSFNVATANYAAGDVVVNVAIKGQETETPVASATGTYMSDKHGSDRYLKVEIDAENGTMTLTRSNTSGGWDVSTAVAEYTYAFDGTTVTVTNVSGQVCTFTWNADGTPLSITWGSAIFTNFTKQ